MNKKLKLNSKYMSVFICIKISAAANKILTESAEKSGRKKIREALMHLEDHLSRFEAVHEFEFVNKMKPSVLN